MPTRHHVLAHPAPPPTHVPLQPDEVSGIDFRHACALYDAGDLAGAADAFGRLCLTYPDRPEAFKALGYMLYLQGQYENASAPLLFASLLDAEDPTPLYFAALSKHRSGDLAAARDIATEARDVALTSRHHAQISTAAQQLIDSL